MSTVEVPRTFRIIGFVVCWSPVSMIAGYFGARLSGEGSQSAWGSAAIWTVVSCMAFSAFFWRLDSGFLVSERRIRLLSLFLAVHAAAFFLWAGLRRSSINPLEVLFAPVTLLAVYWMARRAMHQMLPEQLRQRLDTRSVADAAEAVRRCERLLADDSTLTDEQLDTVRLNLARALAYRSALPEYPDGLFRASELLRQVLARPDAEPLITWEACDDLVDAIRARYDKNGDATGYEEAVELMRSAAERAESPWMIDHAALTTATYYGFRSSDTDDERAAEVWRARAQRKYEELTTGDHEWQVLCEAHRGVAMMLIVRQAETLDERRADLDRAVEEARRARAVGRRQSRHATDMMICRALLRRAGTRGPSRAADLEEAAGLARAWWRSPDELRWQRSTLLAEALDEQSQDGAAGRRWRSIDDVYRSALAGAVRFAGDTAVQIATDWADSAIRRRSAAEAAEALWRLMTIVPGELRRRYVRRARDRFASVSQGAAAEAGYRLAQVGRVRDAVVAVDYSRAVGITEAGQVEPPQLVEQLREYGRPDLADRWRQARQRLEAAERRQFREGAAGSDADEPGQLDLRTDLQRSWSEWDAVNHEVATLTGRTGAMVRSVPDFEEIRSAATAPLVYVAAARDEGYALIVSSTTSEPVVVPLPGLTEQVVEDHALRYLDGMVEQDGSWTGGLDDLLADLWTTAVEPILRVAPPGPVLVFVPVGALSLLPLHAAGPAGGPPPIPITYAPNARLFDRSLRTARASESSRPTVLAVDTPDVEDHDLLPYAAAETARIADLYGLDRCVRLRHASRGAVLMDMPDHSVWHFACHSRADLVDALDGGLVLDDGILTVREIMAQANAPRRLAVLSACTSGLPDPDLLDEVVSFPGALLRAGVATVISTQWEVHDVAASLLITRFHESWVDGAPPPIALARAQRWLRQVSNQELATIDPTLFRPSIELAPEHHRMWEDIRPFAGPYYWAAFSCTGA